MGIIMAWKNEKDLKGFDKISYNIFNWLCYLSLFGMALAPIFWIFSIHLVNPLTLFLGSFAEFWIALFIIAMHLYKSNKKK